ncbi:MAG TPA: peptidoglycan DD-metalloendopeptidase family protein [Solirubrobacteraceae bacterium]|nr:peptidoglycan DD-metalloendopeptidase family protein [Solirubrobacteraceae bacterium]
MTAGLVALAMTAGPALIASTPPPARAASTGQLQQQIASGHRRISSLSSAVASDTRRVNQLTRAVAAMAAKLNALQHDLTANLAQLYALRSELSSVQARLKRLEATEAIDEQVLAAQLVGTYEGGQPNIIDVVLQSTGFNDLLERLSFAQRIGRQDAQIAARVKAARTAVAAQAVRLGTLSARQQRLAEQILAERNGVARDKLSLVSQQLAAARARESQAGQLTSARSQVSSLTAQLTQLQEAQRAAAQRAAARRAAAQSQQSASAGQSSGPGSGGSGGGGGSQSPAAAPTAPVSGGFEFPMPKSAASPPATWSLDDGVDISAPGGTPELAVCSGTIVLHGIGGFGPSAPVIHCDSPLAGYDYVYYGHAGPGNWTPIGTHVAQGQVISEVGYGIVGISTGPHLEVGFADSSGAPIGPSSAPAMMSLLQGSY